MAEKYPTLTEIVDGIHPISLEWVERARGKTAQLVMPPRALGRLHDLGERICGIQKTLSPGVENPAVVVMAGDHGVAAEGVSAFPQEVTGEMIKTFVRNGAGINVLTGMIGARIVVVDMGIIPVLDEKEMHAEDRLWIRKISRGTANFTLGPAMTRAEAEKAVLSGFQVSAALFEEGVQMLGTGDMGIGNTTPSAAIGAVVTGGRPEDLVGRGTGIDDDRLARKVDIVKRALEINNPDPRDGLDVLSKVGGFEIGGIAGAVLAAAYHRKPVVIDGFISTAGALIACTLCPRAADYMFAGHCSEEPGHRRMLDHLQLNPILDLGMRLGEGTGGALAMHIIRAAVKIFNDMMTFEEAGVSQS